MDTSSSLSSRVEAFLKLSDDMIRCGKSEEAIKLCTRVIELDPENIQAYLKRSYVYLQLQMFNKVIADCTTALNFDKTCFEALYRRAQAAMELEKYSAAVLDIETCIRLGRSLSVSNKWTTLAQKMRPLARKLSENHCQVFQEEFDEFYQSMYRLHVKEQLAISPYAEKATDMEEYYPIHLSADLVQVHHGNSEGGVEVAQLDLNCVLNNSPTFKNGSKETILEFTIQSERYPIGTPVRDIINGGLLFLRVYATNSSRERILPVLSLLPSSSPYTFALPLDPSSNVTVPDVLDQQLTTVATYRTISVLGEDVLIRELPDSIGTKIWDCALFLIRYLEEKCKRDESYLRNKRVIEIGAGTGIVGLCCWAMGAKETIVTDLGPILPNIRANVHLNKLAKCLRLLSCENSESVSRMQEKIDNIRVEELDWDRPLSEAFHPPYDMVVASDVIYELVDVNALRHALDAISGQQTTLFLAYRCRGFDATREQQIFACLSESFDIEDVPDLNPDIVYNARILQLRKKIAGAQ